MGNYLFLTDGVKSLGCIDAKQELIIKIAKECGAVENS